MARLAAWVTRIERPVPPDAAPPVLSMVWLLRLRWAAVLGQMVTVLAVTGLLKVALPVGALLALIGVTAASNYALCRRGAGEGIRLRRRFERVLAFDTLTLTALLLLSGGMGNPFSSFYLVHVAMAAVALGRAAAWRMVVLSTGCLLTLYCTSCVRVDPIHIPHDLHLSGMIVSAVLTAAAIASFAGHLHRSLQKREAELARLAVLRDLLVELPDLRVVILTGYGSIATALEALRIGAVDYLTQPADADRILAAFEDPGGGAPASGGDAPEVPTLDRVEWEHIQRVLLECAGNISEAARRLGLHRRTLQRKLDKLPPPQ